MVAADATSGPYAADDEPPRAWAMYFGDSDRESGEAIASDAAGRRYVIGSVSPGMKSLLKFDSAGTLLYSVPIAAWAYDVAAAPDGSAVVVGSRSFTTDVFVMKVSASGSTDYVTNIPGLTMTASTLERPAIAVDRSGAAIVAGRSVSGTLGVPQTNIGPGGGGEDAVVVVLDQRGGVTSAVVIGGSDGDAAAEVAVDAAGSIYVIGRTRSPDFPVTAGAARPASPPGTCAQPQPNRCDDAFLVALSSRGDLALATYYGGGSAERPVDVAVDRSGGIYVTGNSFSRDLPVVRALQPSPRACSPDPIISCGTPYVVHYDRTGAIFFATYLSGTCCTEATGIAVDDEGNGYVVGTERGNDFPVLRAPQPDNGGGPMAVSTDGRSWSAAKDLRANGVNAIAWSGINQPVVYAGSDRGLFVSADYGMHWTERAFADLNVLAVAVDPASPAIVYASTGADRIQPARAGGLFKSLDGGQTWVELSGGLGENARGNVWSIAIAPSQTSTLYIAAGAPGFVYASDDGGSTWRGGTENASAVGVDPSNPSRVYATWSSMIKTSSDGGRTWRTTAGSPTDRRRFGPIVPDRAQSSLVYVGYDSGVARSRDAGETWEFIDTFAADNVVNLSTDPAAPGDVWAAQRGIYRMTAGSSTFSAVDIRSPFTDRISANGGRLLASARWHHNGFVTAFGPSGVLLWSTFLGGNSPDVVTGVSADAGSIHVVGTTQSEIFPLAQAGPRPFGGNADLLIARYDIPRPGTSRRWQVAHR
jgi:hypothetical protein